MGVQAALGFSRSLAVYRLNLLSQRRMRRLYGQFVLPGDLAFDIGAHVGDRIWALRSLGCRVVAVEPQPLFMRFLHLLYGRSLNVALEFCALGAKAGSGEMLVSRRNPTLSSLSPDWVGETGQADGFRHVSWDDRTSVRIDTLDALIARHGAPSFCKIDVEGFELNVLQGLSYPIPTLSFEFLRSQPHRAAQCLEQIARIGGYRFNISYGERLELMLPEWCSARDIAQHIEQLPNKVSSGDIYACVDLKPKADR